MSTGHDYRISRRTAEFADPVIEADFRTSIEKVWARSTRIALAIVALIYFAFAWSDYLKMGATGQYAIIFFARLGVCLLGILALLYADRYAKWLVNGAIPTVLVLTVHLVFVLIIPYRDISPGGIGMSMMAMLMGVYVFVPNRFLFSIGVGTLATTGFIWQVMVTYHLGFANTIHFIMLMAVINLLGGIAVYRVTWQLREQYISTLTLRDANAKLHDEITTRQALEARLRNMAMLDDLTGIANRRQFFDWAERELLAAQRGGKKLSLLLVDIDHFRQINDRYGHVRSDEVLRALVGVCQRWLKEGEWIARFGGEELVVMLPQLELAAAAERADELRQAVERATIDVVDATLHCTVSIGIAELQADDSLGMLLRRADAALHNAKAAGRNRVNATPTAFPA